MKLAQNDGDDAAGSAVVAGASSVLQNGRGTFGLSYLLSSAVSPPAFS